MLSDTGRMKPFRQTRLGYAVISIWFFLGLCLCILTGVSLVQPQWLEHTTKGSLGLYQSCTPKYCPHRPFNLAHSLSPWWSAGAMFVLFATMTSASSLLAAAFWVLFLKRDTNKGLFISGILQFIGGFFLILTCLLYPMGWNNREARRICGPAADRYSPGDCRVGWTYILTLLAALDGIILGMILLWLIERETPSPSILQSGWSPEIDIDSDNENNDTFGINS